MPSRRPAPGLLKMAELVRLTGVPAPTIRFYLREGLLGMEPVRTSPNMAYYDPAIIPRIKAIKEIQRTRFLPLRLIRNVLEATSEPGDERVAAEAIARVLREAAASDTATRAELLDMGVPQDELDWLERSGLVVPTGTGDARRYEGDDLALVRLLREARLSGLTYEMLPFSILEGYVRAVRALVEFEVGLLREGVVPRAGRSVPAVAEVAARLSERLVVLLRRKIIAQALAQAGGWTTGRTRAARASQRRGPGSSAAIQGSRSRQVASQKPRPQARPKR